MTINIVACKVPHVNATLSPNEDGSYTIFIKNDISDEQVRQEILHELTHIKNNDFYGDLQADLIERMVRKSKTLDDTDEINFYYHTLD